VPRDKDAVTLRERKDIIDYFDYFISSSFIFFHFIFFEALRPLAQRAGKILITPSSSVATRPGRFSPPHFAPVKYFTKPILPAD